MDQNIEVIVLSDDDEEDCTVSESSVVIVEENERIRADAPKTSEVLDEDVTITFSRKANVLPHARYDCTIPFCFTESDVTGPEDNNAAFCEQCFCYVCDKLASTCKFWAIPGFCHCNAHKRSFYWKSLRDKSIMGYLHELSFTFDPTDMDADLRRAEASLQEFAYSLALEFATFLMGVESQRQPACCCCHCHLTNSRTLVEGHLANGSEAGCQSCYSQHVNILQYDYSAVQDRVCVFLDEAVQENPKTCVVMLLGAMKLITTHSAPGNTQSIIEVSKAVTVLLYRVKSMVQTLLVDANFPASFTKHLQRFYQGLPFPPTCMALKNSLNVLPWDDPLLSAVLKGQNVSGERRVKGRRPEVLLESVTVIRARVQKLQQQNKYRELARYLKVVKSHNVQELQDLSDWAPLYLCKVGDYTRALDAMFSSGSSSSCPASRLSPAQFCAYLRILVSGHAPSDMPNPLTLNSLPDPLMSSTWTPIQGGSLLKRLEIVKFALRVLNCNDAVFAQPVSWLTVVNVASSASISPDGTVHCTSLPEPDCNFLTRTRDVAQGILSELSHASRIQIPKTFQNGYPDQALLLLATQALALRILHSRLCPALHIIMAFRLNPWAVYWLFYSLLGQSNVVLDFLCVILEELLENRHESFLRKQDTAGQCFVANFLHLFFLEHSVVFDPNTYPTNELVARWNEAHHPWQYHLRRMLEIKEQILTPDKHMVLQMIRWRLHK